MNKINSIMLVDDDEATNFINELLIKRTNITNELLKARNGKEAIELIRQRCLEQYTREAPLPDLIFLDINMPVMDGFDFLKSYQTLDCPGKESVVIAVLTTSLNPKDIEKVQAAGIKDFLNKPLTKDVLSDLWNKYFAEEPSES
jgi:CheY-like chemotaxis protein